MTKFLNNADIKGYIAQTAVTSYLLKADSTGRLVAAIAGTDYQAPTTALLPSGGTAGQILAKIDGTNYNAQWIDNFAQQIKYDVKLGAALSKGTPVYVSSANGTNIIVSASSNATEATSSKTLGLLEAGGALNDIVKVVSDGLLSGLNTSAATIGDPVWLGVDGALIFGLANKPSAPAHLVYIGAVTRVHATNGEIFIKVQNGFELDELHNVALSSVADGQGLFYESATSLWKNKTIASVLGYTPANGANYLPLTGGTLTGALSGTSATFQNTSDTYSLTLAQSNASNAGWGQWADTGGNYKLSRLGGGVYSSPALTIALGGAATFSSSVTATQFIANGNSAGGFEGLRIINASTGAAQIALNNSAQSWIVNLRTDNHFSVYNVTSATTPFLINTSGAATFSSSIAAGGIVTAPSQFQLSGSSLPTGLNLGVGGNTPLLEFHANFRNSQNTTYRGGELRIDTRDGQSLFSFLSRAAGSTVDNFLLSLSEAGQLKLTTYTSATSYSGTAAGYLAFDSSGNVITVGSVAATDNTKLPFNGVSTRFTGDVNTLGLSGTTGVYNLGVATNAPSTYGTLLGFWNTDISTQLYLSYNGSAYWRPSASNTFVGAAWRTFLDSSNYNSYALPLSGGTMSGILAFSNTTGNKIDFYYTISAGVGDRYGIQVQSSELRIHSGAQGAASGGITFGKSDSNTFTEAMRIRNDGLIAVVNNLVVGSQQGFDNPGGWNKNILIDGTNHGRFRIKASNYTYGNIDVALWADSSVSPSHGINGSNAVFAFNGAITTLTVGGQTVIHTGNIGSQSVNYATTSGTASNISAYTINQNLGTGNSPSFADGIFGTTGGATDQGIQIRYQNYVSGYGRIRFYQSDSNHQTIHSFSATWQNGTLAGASAGAINIAGQNGVTFGDWNNADAYIVKGGQTYARGYRGIGNVAGTGEATYHPAGVYSTGTNWLYGTIYMNNNPIRDVMDIYNNSWFRNNGSLTGLYNQTNGNHFYSNASAEWSITGAGGNVGLVFKSNHESGLRGYVYGDTSSNFGLLNNQGGWSVMCYPGTGYGGDLKGTWTMAGNTIITSANIGSQTVDGLNTTFLNTGSTNISSGYSRVIRNENGSGGNPNYAPVLHLAASDTMWQIAGSHGGSTTLVWRSGYAGNWSTPWWNILHSGNASYAWNMNQNVRTSDNVTFNYINSPSGYVSNGNPWGTSNSAYFPNGITTAGGTNWIYGSITYIGNAPSNGAGHQFTNSGDSRHTGTITPNYIGRPSHSTGFLVGSYNNIGGNSTNTNPIYTIGSSYLPSDSSLGGMYGIGYSHPNFWGSGKVQGWGMYVCSNGIIDAIIGGDGASTSIWAKTDIVAYSDARVKENVEVIPNAIEKIKALRGVTFTRNDVIDKTKRSAGVIAQEVLAVHPEVVSGTDEDMYSVAYGNMAGLFIEAIKEQQAQIVAQGAQITELMEIIKTMKGL